MIASSRETSPLTVSSEAVVIDSTERQAMDVIAEVVQRAREAGLTV